MTAIHLLTSNSFFTSLPDFIELCNVLSGSASTLGEFDPADASEIAWGITEALLICPPDEEDKTPFASQIIDYISHVVEQEGMLVPPDILKLGTHDNSVVHKIQYQFSDDPEMFNMIWNEEKSKTDDINNLVKTRLTALIKQLQELPLKHGSTEDIAKKMLRSLYESQKQEEEMHSVL